MAGWVQAGLGAVATAYFTKAAQKMAEKDFEDFGITDLFKMALNSIKWFARIGKHIGDVTIREFKNVRFSDDHSQIGLINSAGEVLFVPKQILDLYISTNPKLLGGVKYQVQHRFNELRSCVD